MHFVKKSMEVSKPTGVRERERSWTARGRASARTGMCSRRASAGGVTIAESGWDATGTLRRRGGTVAPGRLYQAVNAEVGTCSRFIFTIDGPGERRSTLNASIFEDAHPKLDKCVEIFVRFDTCVATA